VRAQTAQAAQPALTAPTASTKWAEERQIDPNDDYGMNPDDEVYGHLRSRTAPTSARNFRNAREINEETGLPFYLGTRSYNDRSSSYGRESRKYDSQATTPAMCMNYRHGKECKFGADRCTFAHFDPAGLKDWEYCLDCQIPEFATPDEWEAHRKTSKHIETATRKRTARSKQNAVKSGR